MQQLEEIYNIIKRIFIGSILYTIRVEIWWTTCSNVRNPFTGKWVKSSGIGQSKTKVGHIAR